jgi:hypothetical protein
MAAQHAMSRAGSSAAERHVTNVIAHRAVETATAAIRVRALEIRNI